MRMGSKEQSVVSTVILIPFIRDSKYSGFSLSGLIRDEIWGCSQRGKQNEEKKEEYDFPLDCPGCLIPVYAKGPGRAMTEGGIGAFQSSSNWRLLTNNK